MKTSSDELGDEHRASIEFLDQAGFGRTSAYYALIASNANETLCGAVVFSPVMSTTLGATGLYVSDLWVAQSVRGLGLGKQLLAHAADAAHVRLGANYLMGANYLKYCREFSLTEACTRHWTQPPNLASPEPVSASSANDAKY